VAGVGQFQGKKKSLRGRQSPDFLQFNLRCPCAQRTRPSSACNVRFDISSDGGILHAFSRGGNTFRARRSGRAQQPLHPTTQIAVAI